MQVIALIIAEIQIHFNLIVPLLSNPICPYQYLKVMI
jgi:hypothetical protein